MSIEASDARGGYQITLPEAERELLMQRIEQDYQAAIDDHKRRLDRCARLYQKWRQRHDPNSAADRDTPNFQVPLTKWHTYSKWAKMVEAIFGDDAEILALPTAPSDERKVRKISRYMTWRVFSSMKLVRPFAEFIFRVVLYGRAHAYRPWVVDTYRQYTPPKAGVLGRLAAALRNRARRALRHFKEVVHYEGPGFLPLSPDELIVPAEDAKTIHDFSFVIRPYSVAAGRMRDDAAKGIYNEKWVKENFQELVDRSREMPEQRDRSSAADPVLTETDKGEKVDRQDAPSMRQGLRVHEWYGRWRMLKPGKDGAAEDDLASREDTESELVVRFLPDMRAIVGVQDLADLYPSMRRRRPFSEAALVYDGTYWCQGVGEMLEELEAELSNNENFATLAGMMSVGPIIFYKPASGSAVVQGLQKYEPFQMIPVDNPDKDVKVVNISANLQHSVIRSQALTAYAERVTSESDLQTGRQSERPNAPRTVGQTVALLEQGNVRAAFDVRFLREDFDIILSEIWELDSDLAPDTLFFRVTEEEAAGLFDVRNGGSSMDRSDRTGQYDFDIRFATSAISKQQKKQDQIALYQIDLQNPLINTNARALWKVTMRLHEAWGDDNFAKLVPEPPEEDMPLPPKDEHVRMLQGEPVEPRPGDNDQQHLIEHDRALRKWSAEPPESRDDNAIAELQRHYQAQIAQMQQKKLMQAMLERVMQNLPGMLPQLSPLMGQDEGGGPSGGSDGFENQPGGGPGGPSAGGPPGGLPNGPGVPPAGGMGV